MDQPAWNSRELTVGQVAERSGAAVSALHFYERKGLIKSRRTAGNQRRYTRDVLRRVALIRVAQRVGVPLAEVAAVLDLLPNGRTPTREDWQRISACWRAELDERIRRLQQLRDDFTDCVGCGCLSIDRCALANPHDTLGTQGAGPRRLLGAGDTDAICTTGGGAACAPGPDTDAACPGSDAACAPPVRAGT